MKRLTCLPPAPAPFAARADLPVKHTAEHRIRASEGRGHDFGRIGSDGGGNYDDMQWKQAIEEFLSCCDNPEYE